MLSGREMIWSFLLKHKHCKEDIFGISVKPVASNRNVSKTLMLSPFAGKCWSFEQSESINSLRAFKSSRQSGNSFSFVHPFIFNKASLFSILISRGSFFTEVPSKYRASRFCEITRNSFRFEQLLRMRVSSETKLISGRELRLVHPFRFRKRRLLICCISWGKVSILVQPSRFNLCRFRAFDKPDKKRKLLAWLRSTHFNFDVSCDDTIVRYQ